MTCTPGGLATAGLINIFLPLCDGNGTQVTFGLADELIRLSLKYGPGKIPPDWMHRKNAAEEERLRCVFSPAAMILALEELLMDNQVDIWYDTLVTGASHSGDSAADYSHIVSFHFPAPAIYPGRRLPSGVFFFNQRIYSRTGIPRCLRASIQGPYQVGFSEATPVRNFSVSSGVFSHILI